MSGPLTDVRQISHIAYGFMASRALFAALNLELFGHIARGATEPAALSAATGVAPHRLSTLLAVLLSLGLVVRDGAGYANAPATERYLVPGATAYFGDYYRFQIDRQIYAYMPHVDAGLAGHEAGLAHHSMGGMMADPQSARDFSRAQHAGSMGPALLMSGKVELGAAKTLLDVAGGTGAYSITFCRKYPQLSATILDFPNVIEVAKGYVADAGMAGRIRLVPGNALETAWPARQDVVLMSYLLSAVGGDDIPALLDAAWAALAPGGRVIVHDFMLREDRAGPLSATLFFLSYLGLRTDAVSFSAGELVPMLEARGFRGIVSAEMIPEITSYIVAEKPA
jgi:2-hydroxy-4-(methylsulfanyl)butanoate S-methyltransferase